LTSLSLFLIIFGSSPKELAMIEGFNPATGGTRFKDSRENNKTVKSNLLRYLSERKYAIFFPSVQEINSVRKLGLNLQN